MRVPSIPADSPKARRLLPFIALAGAIGAAVLYLFATDPNGTWWLWVGGLPLAWIATFLLALRVCGRKALWLLLTAPFGLAGWLLVLVSLAVQPAPY